MTTPKPSDDKLSGLRREELEDIAAVLPYLGREAGRLTLYGVPFERLCDPVEPWLIYLPERARDNARSLTDAFAEHFDVRLHFPLKCCYLPAIATALRADGHGVEVMSELEWRLARGFGFTPEQVVANSPARTRRHRRDLVAAGAGLVGVDSLSELDHVIAEARSQGRITRVAVRVNTLYETDAFVTAGSKLGCDIDGAAELIERALSSRWCEVVALHAHQLRHHTDPDRFHRMVRGMADLAAQTAGPYRPFPVYNLGGGLEARFLLERAGSTAADFAEAARDALAPLPVRPRVILEPGRYVAGDAAVGVTGIVGRKVNSGRTWLITDLSSNVLIPLPELAYHPVPLRLRAEADWERVHLGDATCAPSRLCGSADLPSSVEDDGLAVLNCGAYTTVYAELWAFPLPRIGVFADGRLREVFGPAQEADMFDALYRPAGVDTATGEPSR